MMKKLLIIACLFIVSQLAKADDEQKIASKVQKVTVFLSGAQVTRSALVNVTAGTSILVFENISPNIDVQSMQVRAPGEFTILSVKHEINYLNEAPKQKRVEELQAAQKILTDKISLQNTLLSINQEEAAMLSKNQVGNGQTGGLNVIKLKQALDFQTARLTEIKKKELSINNEIELLNAEVQKNQSQLNEISRSKSIATSNVLVTVSAKAALQSAFTLTYIVRNASWYPTYDVRAKNVNSPVTIAYKANVSQQCGEDWKNIKLTLSTGNPTVSGTKPELTPYYLSTNMYYAQPVGSLSKVSGRVLSSDNGVGISGVTIRVKGTSIGTQSDVNGSYNLQIPAGNPILQYSFLGFENTEMMANQPVMNVTLRASSRQLNEVVVTGYGASAGSASQVRYRKESYAETSVPVAVLQTESQTNMEFNIENPFSVPNDGKQYAVEIDEITTNASFQYYVAPKLSTDVFLTARITDWNKYNFLSGEANLFFEGTFIGKSLIDTRAANDTLNLSLGIDKNIVVKRTLQKDLTERQSIGANKKESRDWLITVKNRKNQQVNLLVEDQVPVSQNSAIEVTTQDVSGAEMDKLTGKTSWSLVVNSQAEKQLHLKYQVKYPKSQSVIVQ